MGSFNHSGNLAIAWVTKADGATYVVQDAKTSGPATVVCRLVSGIYAEEGFASLHVLRRRLYTTAMSNSFDAALIKVAAKRLSCEVSFAGASYAKLVDLSATPLADISTDRTASLGGAGVKLTEEDALRVCQQLAHSVPLEPERFVSSRPIAAMVLDRGGRLLAAAVNNNVVNRLRHAEFNLVFNRFSAEMIPQGATVYTSLSPCRMCAALLARAAVDGENLRVVALNQDYGRYGRQQALTVELAP